MPENTSGHDWKPGIRMLDYPKAKLRMDITTEMEGKYRISACEKEPWTVEFIEKQPPNTWFIDIGANVGAYTLVAIAHGLRVVSIEPHIHTAERLAHNLELNDLADKAIIMVMGLSDQTGFDFFSMADLRPGYNDHVFGKHKNELAKRPNIFHTHIVPTMRLDDFIPLLTPNDVPIAMKLDVDGVEDRVLNGAINSLRNSALRAMMLELDKKHADSVLKVMGDLGWHEVRRIDETTPLANNHYGRERFGKMFYIEMEK